MERRTVNICAPGTTRTCDLRFRKPLLYPLSYGSEERSESHFETDMKVSVFWPLRVSVYSNLFFSQITWNVHCPR